MKCHKDQWRWQGKTNCKVVLIYDFTFNTLRMQSLSLPMKKTIAIEISIFFTPIHVKHMTQYKQLYGSN
jgi:hypothetical protein